jgi:hypothetical protein
MKPSHIFVTFLLFAFISCNNHKQSGESIEIPNGYEALFNGKDLSGWYSYADEQGKSKELFEVVEGAIHTHPNMDTSKVQSFGALQTERVFENYILELEYKWGTKKFKPRESSVRDAGILFHQFGPDKIWPRGAECQIQEGDTGDLWLVKVRGTSRVSTIDLCYQPDHPLLTLGDGKTEYAHVPRNYYWEIPGWNKVKMEVNGDEAKFYVNGKLVNEVMDLQFFDDETGAYIPLTKGKILLQAEGAEVYYRNIFIKEL